LPEIIKTLNELGHDIVDASQLRKSLKQFEIVFQIELLRRMFVYANEVSEYLQKTDIDILNASSLCIEGDTPRLQIRH
jgi:hypothetical protein